ncbi:MAG: VOC family protein [Candidatus Nanopelagicales bacterium]
MLAAGSLIAFVPVTDIGRAMHFYGDLLGLAVTDQAEAWCTLGAHGATLRLTLVDSKPDVEFTKVGWAVNDIAATVRELVNRGVAFQRYPNFEQDDSGIWTSPNGDRVAWLLDPDQNILSITQFAD